jgi:hypothetical protein
VLLPPQSARGALTPVVEAQELGDPPADAEPGDVCAGQVERVEQAGGVGDEVAQGVLRVVRIHRRGATGVTQLVADHEPRVRGEAPAELVLPGEHRVADQEDRRVGGVAERLDAEVDAVDVDDALARPLRCLHVGMTHCTPSRVS